MYSVLKNEAPEYISNLYIHSPLHYSNSRTYQLSLPRPRIDIKKKKEKVQPSLMPSLVQTTSDIQILSLAQLLQAEDSYTS